MCPKQVPGSLGERRCKRCSAAPWRCSSGNRRNSCGLLFRNTGQTLFLEHFHVQGVHGYIKWGVLQKNAGGHDVFEMLRYRSSKSYIKTIFVTRKEHRVIYRLALRYFQRLATFHVLLISQSFLSSLLFHLSHEAIEIWDWFSNIILGKCPPFSLCHEIQHKRTFLMRHQL